jgi:ABC-2 type transport system ATP-binding protein
LFISENESFGLVGNNGAGKTTMLSLILDLIKANDGEVLIKGENVAQSEDWKNFTGSYVDEGFLIGFLSISEYLYFTGSLYGLNKRDVDEFQEQHDEFLSKEMFTDGKVIRDLSAGNKSKVGILSSLIGNPELLILDEPFANLDPSSQLRLISMLQVLQKDHNVTLVISSHDLNHITTVCERIVLLENGKIAKDLNKRTDTLGELEEYFAV